MLTGHSYQLALKLKNHVVMSTEKVLALLGMVLWAFAGQLLAAELELNENLSLSHLYFVPGLH